jgi:hypothetical protein
MSKLRRREAVVIFCALFVLAFVVGILILSIDWMRLE